MTWPSWLFARGDLAAGGAGDERPLEFSDASLKVETRRRLSFFRGFRGGPRGPALPTGGTARIYLNAVLVNPDPKFKPVIVWRNPTIQFRKSFGRPGQTRRDSGCCRTACSEPSAGKPADAGRGESAAAATERSCHRGIREEARLRESPDGSVMGPEDFASEGSTSFEVKVPDGFSLFELQVEAEVGSDRNQVFRITISDREDGSTRRVPVWGLAGDPQSAGYKAWKAVRVRVRPHSSSEFAWRTHTSGQGPDSRSRSTILTMYPSTTTSSSK